MARGFPGALRCSGPRAPVRGYRGWDVGVWHRGLGAFRDALVFLKSVGDRLQCGSPLARHLAEDVQPAAGRSSAGPSVRPRRQHLRSPGGIRSIATPLGWPDAGVPANLGAVPHDCGTGYPLHQPRLSTMVDTAEKRRGACGPYCHKRKGHMSKCRLLLRGCGSLREMSRVPCLGSRLVPAAAPGLVPA